MNRLLKNTLSDFVHLFYPEVCAGCRRTLFDHENILCLSCHSQLPIAYDILESDEKVKDLFYGRASINHARSLFFYEKIGVVQELIHQLKYEGQEKISTYLGYWMAEFVTADPAFSTITHIVPVPIHPKRLRKRGYNQVNGFGKALAEQLNVKFIEDLLIKTVHTINQAKLGQVKRSDETNTPYAIKKGDNFKKPPHFLIVDDVITTGTTLSLCIKELQKIPEAQISIATMAISV